MLENKEQIKSFDMKISKYRYIFDKVVDMVLLVF